MAKRTTIEIDEDLLARAKRGLGTPTTRATVEEALRRAADAAESGQAELALKRTQYFDELRSRADLAVLTSGGMWT